MANQRPINRRPWRKAPWSRAKKRPTRWNAVSPGYTPEAGQGLNLTQIFGVGAVPLVSPSFTLVSGQVDVEPWADEQEVTLDKIIGRFTFWSTYAVPAGVHPPYLKVGILLLEEITQDIDPVRLNLYEQETMEDYEWLWLWSGSMDVESYSDSTIYARKDLDVYSKNRRKIGQSDELVVYAQTADNFTQGGPALANVLGVCDLRTILMSR